MYSVDDFLFGLIFVQSEVAFLFAESAVRSMDVVLLEKSFSHVSPVGNTFSIARGREDNAINENKYFRLGNYVCYQCHAVLSKARQQQYKQETSLESNENQKCMNYGWKAS